LSELKFEIICVEAENRPLGNVRSGGAGILTALTATHDEDFDWILAVIRKSNVV
jgi:hypothetical protein